MTEIAWVLECSNKILRSAIELESELQKRVELETHTALTHPERFLIYCNSIG